MGWRFANGHCTSLCWSHLVDSATVLPVCDKGHKSVWKHEVCSLCCQLWQPQLGVMDLICMELVYVLLKVSQGVFSKDEATKLLVMSTVLHAADVSNPCRAWEVLVPPRFALQHALHASHVGECARHNVSHLNFFHALASFNREVRTSDSHERSPDANGEG
eukprot:6489228-Amphidinium_carterae.1